MEAQRITKAEVAAEASEWRRKLGKAEEEEARARLEAEDLRR